MTHRLISKGQLVLMGFVGLRGFLDDAPGFTAMEVVKALDEIEGDITVRINSGGGFAFEGIAIYRALKQHDGEVTVMVDGIAASAASIIAMAGDEIVMPTGSVMMIHNGSGLTFGTKEDHQKSVQMLGTLDGEIVAIYAEKASGTKAHFARLMTEETWLNGDEAVDLGLADRTTDAAAAEPTAFIYQAYRHAPKVLVERFEGIQPKDAALARFITEQGERPGPLPAAGAAAVNVTDQGPDGPSPAASAAITQRKDKPMSEKPKAPADKTVEPAQAVTLESVTANHPEIAEALRQAGADAERERILGIEKNALPGHDDLVAKLKADGKTSPAEAAVQILQAEKAKNANRLEGMKDVENSLGSDKPEAAPSAAGDQPAIASAPEGEDKWRAEWEKDSTLQADFPDVKNYFALKRAEAAGRVRSLSPRAA